MAKEKETVVDEESTEKTAEETVETKEDEITVEDQLKNLEDEVKSTRDDVKSILYYQEQKNAFIESELEEMRNEVASCYEHFEAFSKEKEDGR